MKNIIIPIVLIACIIILCVVLIACNSNDTDGTTTLPEENTDPPKTEKVAFLIIGQSNAAGRGELNDKYKIDNNNLFMWRDKQWMKAKEPLSEEQWKRAGTSLAMSFIDAYQKEFGGEVGIIQCAVGGTSITQWAKEQNLYLNAWNTALDAMEDGTKIVGILWHQGESDASSPAIANNYDERCYNLLTALVDDLGLDEDTPIIVGELADFFSASYKDDINAHLNALADTYSNWGCASGKGLRNEQSADDYLVNGKPTHFDTPSLRLLGLRYFAEYYKIVTGEEWEFDDTLVIK